MRFLADENFNNHILKGLRGALPDLDIVRAQDTEIYQAPDPDLLDWAANEGRIVLTHDIKTIPKYANERLAAGLPVPGVVVIDDEMPIGDAIDDLNLMISAGTDSDFAYQVRYVPIR